MIIISQFESQGFCDEGRIWYCRYAFESCWIIKSNRYFLGNADISHVIKSQSWVSFAIVSVARSLLFIPYKEWSSTCEFHVAYFIQNNHQLFNRRWNILLKVFLWDIFNRFRFIKSGNSPRWLTSLKTTDSSEQVSITVRPPSFD